MEGTNLLHSVLCENLCQKREKGTKSKSIIELIPCIKNIYSFLVTKKVLIRFWLINRHRLLLLSLFFFFFFFQERTKSNFRFASIAGCDVFAGLLCWFSRYFGICLCFIEFHSGKLLRDAIKGYCCCYCRFSSYFLIRKMEEKQNKVDKPFYDCRVTT